MCVCVNVWGGVHCQAGNAPRYRNSSPPTYITQPFSSFPGAVFFFSPLPYLHLSSLALLAVYFFSPPYLSIVRCSCEHQQQTVTLARSLLSQDSTLLFCAGMQQIPSQRALRQLHCGFDVNCSISPGRREPQPHPLSNVTKQKVEYGKQVCPAQAARSHDHGAFSANTYSANICHLNKTARLQSKCNTVHIYS